MFGCTMRAARLFSSLVLFFVAPLAFSQQCSSYVAVNAFDAGSKAPLRGLAARDFTASMGSSIAEVVSIQPAFRNRAVVLVDAASPTILNSVADILREAPEGMPVAFAAFGEHSVLSNGFFSRGDERNVAIDTVLAGSKNLGSHPRVLDALHRAAGLFEHPQPGDTILLVTDRHEAGSRIHAAALRQELQKRGIRVQFLLPPVIVNSDLGAASLFTPWTLIDRADDRIIELAAGTGGAFMGFMNAEWLSVASSGYVMQLLINEASSRKARLHLALRQTGGKLFYSPRVLPCKTSLVADVR